MKKQILSFFSAVSLFLPASAFALEAAGATFKDLVSSFTGSVVTSLISLAATVGVAAFFYGIARYIWGIRQGETKKIEEGNKFIIWGLVALFILFSVWGIIQYAQEIFGFDKSRSIIIPNR